MRAAGCTIHIADHVGGAGEDRSDVMPLSIIHELAVSGKNVDGANIRFVQDRAERAVAGDAHAPGVWIRAADKSHFGQDHAGVGCLDPCGDRPIACAHVEAGAGDAARCGVGRERKIVGAVKRQSGVRSPSDISCAHDCGGVVIA